MMKTDLIQLFISRQLSAESPILTKYPKADYQWTDLSMIDFSPLAFELPDTEWLFFYSKNGVKYLHKSKQDISHKKVACLGPGTANAYQKCYAKPADFVGSGEKHETSRALTDLIGNQPICFVRGKNSVRSIQRLLEGKIQQREVIVYDNHLIDGILLGHYEVAIITSPMNYNGFLQNGGSASHLISIGQTTAKKIKEINTVRQIKNHLMVAESPTEKALVNSLEKLLPSIDSSE